MNNRVVCQWGHNHKAHTDEDTRFIPAAAYIIIMPGEPGENYGTLPEAHLALCTSCTTMFREQNPDDGYTIEAINGTSVEAPISRGPKEVSVI